MTDVLDGFTFESMSATKTKSTSVMLAEAPKKMGVLLCRFQRDVHSLADYLTPDEQAKQLGRICEAIRNHLMIDHCWSHEMSTAMANEYRMTLTLLLKRPEYFNPALLPRQRPEPPYRQGNPK